MEPCPAIPSPPRVVDYASLAPTSCLRARRERAGLVIELSPPGFRDAPRGILVFLFASGAPMLVAVARMLWLLREARLPLSAWRAVVAGAEGRGWAGLFLLALATVPVYALLCVVAWKGRSINGPAVFHLTDDGWIAKRHGPSQCWGAHRANVVGVERRLGRLYLRMRAGHTLDITGGTSRRRRDLDWLEATFREYLGTSKP
jgi:hypothetical protein